MVNVFLKKFGYLKKSDLLCGVVTLAEFKTTDIRNFRATEKNPSQRTLLIKIGGVFRFI